MANKATSVVDVILGEAAPSSYDDMLAVASVIANRAEQLGVSPEEVVSVNSEFNAYGKALPPGAEKNRQFAASAWRSVVTNGPVNNATFFATPSTTGNLPKGLVQETATNGHVYYSDPKNRAIKTSAGFKTPSAATLASAFASLPASTDVVPEYRPDFTAPIMASYAPQQSTGSSAYPDDLPHLTTDFQYKTVPEYAYAGGIPMRGANGKYNAVPTGGTYSQGSILPSLEALAGASLAAVGSNNSDVLSGMRTDAYNTAVAYNNDKRTGSLHKPDEHGYGHAMDISMAGMSDGQRAQLVQELAQRGVGRIGLYSDSPNMMHIDTGARTEGPHQPHFMFDQSIGNMKNAPDWFKSVAATGGLNFDYMSNIPVPTFRDEALASSQAPPAPPAPSGPPLGTFDSPSATTRSASQGPLTSTPNAFSNPLGASMLSDPGIMAALSFPSQQSPQASIPSPSQIDPFSGFNSAGDWTGGRVAAPTSSPSYSAPANTPANMGAAGYGITGTPARTTTQKSDLTSPPNSGMSLADQYANYGYGRSLAQQAANAALSPKVGDTFSSGAKLAPGTVVDTEELPTGQYRVTAPAQQTAANKALGGMFPGATKPSALGIMAGLFPGMTSMPAIAGSLIGGAIAGPFGAIAGNRLGSMLPAFKSSGGTMPSNPVNVVSNTLPSGTVKSYTDPSTGWRSVTNQYGVTTTDLGGGLRATGGGGGSSGK